MIKFAFLHITQVAMWKWIGWIWTLHYMVTWWDREGNLQKNMEAPNWVLGINNDAIHWESDIQEKT